jgi:hypothetical protein
MTTLESFSAACKAPKSRLNFMAGLKPRPSIPRQMRSVTFATKH